jgi:hypothetical protein
MTPSGWITTVPRDHHLSEALGEPVRRDDGDGHRDRAGRGDDRGLRVG